MRNPVGGPWPTGSSVRVRGRRWAVVHQSNGSDCSLLRLRGSDPFTPSILRTLLLPFDRPRSVPSTSTVVVNAERWLRVVQRAALEAAPFGGLFPAAAGRIDLHPYQMEPALAALRDGSARILIADAVGLGKTVQAGLLMRQLSAERDLFRGLVVVPASLREQWSVELKERFDLQSTVMTSTSLARAARELPDEVSPWSLPGVYICSFEFIRRPEVLRPLEDSGWDLLVVDEAHAATVGSARRAAVDAVAQRSRRVVLLTATPHAGDDEQFRSLCRIGRAGANRDPVLLFQRSRTDVGIKQDRRTVFLTIALSPAERRAHRLLERYTSALCAESPTGRGAPQQRLLAIVLRKRALSSVSALSASCRRRLSLLQSDDQPNIGDQLSLPLDDDEVLQDDEVPEALLGAAGLGDVVRERRWLEAIAESAECAARHDSKVERLKRFLSRVKEPVIVFTEYRDTLARLQDALGPAFPALDTLHGGMIATERSIAQRRFNERGTLLLATDAAAEGLNLHHRCRIVVHFELPWSPARLEQRTGRVDRMGQTRRVHEILLVASDTAERLVLAPLARRVSRSRTLGASPPRLLETLSESRVAAAILDGTPLESRTVSFEQDVTRAEPHVGHAARLEAARIADLRCWIRHPTTTASINGYPVAVVGTEKTDIAPGVIRVCTLTLSAADGAIIHTEVVALHQALHVRWPSEPDDVRQSLGRLSLQHEALHELLPLFEARIEQVRISCARVAAVLSTREETMSSVAESSARRLVQRGLFDRRSEIEDHERARVQSAIHDDRMQHLNSLNAWQQLTPSLRLLAILLVNGPVGR
jgi:hypothetical protein